MDSHWKEVKHLMSDEELAIVAGRDTQDVESWISDIKTEIFRYNTEFRNFVKKNITSNTHNGISIFHVKNSIREYMCHILSPGHYYEGEFEEDLKELGRDAIVENSKFDKEF